MNSAELGLSWSSVHGFYDSNIIDVGTGLRSSVCPYYVDLYVMINEREETFFCPIPVSHLHRGEQGRTMALARLRYEGVETTRKDLRPL